VLALTWALSGMLSGRLSDRLGTRKPNPDHGGRAVLLLLIGSGLMAGFVGLLAARALMVSRRALVLPVSQSLMVEASASTGAG